MNDLGLGLLDRRTVIVALFTIVIVNTFFQYNLPIRTSNAGELFLDLVLFTGYIYLARSLFRLPFVLLLMILSGIYGVYNAIREFKWSSQIEDMIEKKAVSKVKIISAKTMHIFSYMIEIFFFTSAAIPAITNRFLNIDGELIEIEKAYDPAQIAGLKRILLVTRFIDRAGFIALIVFATIPKFISLTKPLGAFGLVVLVAIYLLKGNFTFLIKDKVSENN